jgi:hypothetical protein
MFFFSTGERRQERTAAAENVPYAAVVVSLLLPHFKILFKKLSQTCKIIS